MKKILVTGGMGFIGSNFIRYMLGLDLNCSIINLDKLTYAGNLDNLKDLKSSNHVFIKGDIQDKSKLEKAFALKPDLVVHFAAESHVDRSISGPLEFINTNVVGTSILLDESLKYYKSLDGSTKDNFRFLHVSTDEVFGQLGLVGKFTEETRYDPSSPYSASKASSDHLVRAWNRTYGLPILITNCSNNYGPFQFPEKLIPLMIINAISGKKLPIYGTGENVRDWLYVNDHCRAILSVIEKGNIGHTYNIGGNCEKSNVDVVKLICDILDDIKPSRTSYSNQISFVEDRPGHDFRYAIDTHKIRRELNWEPEESFETGIKKTIHWYLENNIWVERIISGEYRN